MGNLRVVFVRIDTDADLFFDKVQELDAPELLRKLFRVTAAKQINRVLQAWCDKRADATVASAYVEHDELVVQSCDLKHYRVRFADFPGLSELPKKQRDKFEIDEAGNHVSWPWTKCVDRFGRDPLQGGQRVPKSQGQRCPIRLQGISGQSNRSGDVGTWANAGCHQTRGGPDERHLYRLMRGQQDLTSTMIERLSKAHRLAHEEYVRELIQACDDIVEQARKV